MWRHAAVMIPCFLLLCGCDSRPDPERIQGEWQLWQMNGWFEFDLPGVKGDRAKIIFTDDRFTFMNDARAEQRVSGTFSCDEGKRPRQITFRFADRSVVAIYSVSRGTLRLCFGKEDLTPPAAFAGGPGSRPALLEFRRPEPK